MLLFRNPHEDERKIYKNYILFDTSTYEDIYDTDELAFYYSNNLNWSLLSFGKPKLIKKHYEQEREMFFKAGLFKNIIFLSLIKFKDIPVNEVNKCIEITNYLKIFCDKYYEKLDILY